MPDTFHMVFPTSFGKIALVWMETAEKPKLRRVILSSEKQKAERILGESFPWSRPGFSVVMEELASRMGEFLRGEDVTFEMDRLQLDGCSQFQQQVLHIEHGVPRGRVTSYRRIAEKLSRPRSARAVGRALAGNPFPILVPCHRAIRSDGTLGGFQGGPAMKRALLTLEGIEFSSNGKVLSPSFF